MYWTAVEQKAHLADEITKIHSMVAVEVEEEHTPRVVLTGYDLAMVNENPEEADDISEITNAVLVAVSRNLIGPRPYPTIAEVDALDGLARREIQNVGAARVRGMDVDRDHPQDAAELRIDELELEPVRESVADELDLEPRDVTAATIHLRFAQVRYHSERRVGCHHVDEERSDAERFDR